METALLVPEGQPAQRGLTFNARSVIVDNLSASWVRIPDANRSVPPWTHGFSTPLLVANNAAVVEWQTPVGLVVPTSGTGQATLTFTTELVPFSPGVVVVQAQPSGLATPAQTHVVVDSGSISFASPQPVTVSAQPVAATISGQPIAVSTKGSTISTVRGNSLSVAQNSTVAYDATFAARFVWTLVAVISYFNCTVAGNRIEVRGSPSGGVFRLADFITPAATNLLFTTPINITWTSPIDLQAVLPGDTSYQLQVTSGPTTTQGAISLTLYGGN